MGGGSNHNHNQNGHGDSNGMPGPAITNNNTNNDSGNTTTTAPSSTVSSNARNQRQQQQKQQKKRLSFTTRNKKSAAAATAAAQLSGEELEEYCKKRGLCPLCATTRTRRRLFKLFKKNKWEPLTVTDGKGGYLVYRGYCVKPNCFTLDQAKRLVGEGRADVSGTADRRTPAGNTNHAFRQRRRDSEDSRTFSVSTTGRPRMRGIRRTSNRSAAAASAPNGIKAAAAAATASVNGTVATSASTSAMSNGNGNSNRRPSATTFPPLALKQSGSHASVDGTVPLPVIATTTQALKVHNNIFILDLSNVPLRHVDVEHLSSALSTNTRLMGLILENCKLNDIAIHTLCQHLNPKTIPLIKLYVRSNHIGNDGVEVLAQSFLQQSPTLEKLDVSRNRVGSDGGITIFDAITNNLQSTKLRCLNLSHNELWDLDSAEGSGDGGSGGIRKCLSTNTTLRVINLEGNYLHDGVAESIALALSASSSSSSSSSPNNNQNQNQQLERLYLGWNTIGDDGCIAIANMMTTNTTLKVLGLAENDIHNIGARAILTALDMNTTIREISGLWRNKIDRRFIIVAIRRLLLSHSDMKANVNPNNNKRMEQAPTTAVPIKSVTAPPPPSSSTPSTTTTTATTTTPAIPNDIVIENEEDRKPPFDRVVFFHASPLVYFNRDDSLHTPIPMLDVEFEEHAIRDSVGQALGAKIEIKSKIATIENFTNSLRLARVLHICCYGHDEYLTMENGYGSLDKLHFGDDLKSALQHHDIQVVFVSSVHAKQIGQAFIDAGIPHVVCCQREDRKFRDSVTTEFIQSFYSALAQNKLLKQAFDIAYSSTLQSCKRQRRMKERFTLLPQKTENDFVHNRPVFFTHSVVVDDDDNDDAIVKEDILSSLPNSPSNFMGREVDMYEIMEALRVDDVIRVGGPSGHGRETVVSAACKYILARKSVFSIDSVFWLPAPEGVTPFEDSLYGDLCTAIRIMQYADGDIWDDEEYTDCRDRIEIELEDLQSIFVIDDRGFSTRSVQGNLEKFISHFMNITKTKIILITSRSMDEYSTISTLSSESGNGTGGNGWDDAIEVGPLDFKSTALLFGGMSKFIASSGCPVAHSAMEFAELLEPPYVIKLQDKSVRPSRRRLDLFERLGGGVPDRVIKAAKSMNKQKFIELIGVANRPEVNVDSLAGVEHDIELRTRQKEESIKEKNYLRAWDLDIILEELEAMRTMFPTISELRQEEDRMKQELADAVSSRQYEHANDLKKELLKLKKQMMKEQRMRAIRDDKSPTNQFNNIQAQVQSLLLDRDDTDGDDDDDEDDNGKKKKQASSSFVVHLDDRDCSFEVSCGTLADFEHPAEAIGIVCWTNESCDLEGNQTGEQLLEYGKPGLEEDIDALPITMETPWGPVKCGTGNAVIVGPEKYGMLDAPCVIMTVGPLSPSNRDDIEPHDGDTLHYVKTMLRSSYRSSLVLVKHAQLQAVALSMLTTRIGGSAYSETLRVGLQTLVDEVKFSYLRDVHIIAATQAEANAIVSVMTEMGLQQIHHHD